MHIEALWMIPSVIYEGVNIYIDILDLRYPALGSRGDSRFIRALCRVLLPIQTNLLVNNLLGCIYL